MRNLGSLEGVQIGAAGFFRGFIHGEAQGTAGESGAGNAVHTGTVGFDHVRNHDIEGGCADMSGFHGADNFDRGQGCIGEGDLEGDRAVVTV